MTSFDQQFLGLIANEAFGLFVGFYTRFNDVYEGF